jgi:glucose/mannose-6-phosphate isomerase
MADTGFAMFDLAMHLPEQMAEAAIIAGRFKQGRRRSCDNVVVAGMGGSAIGGDIFRGLLADSLSIPILSCRDYAIPAAVTSRTLFVAISYSGNTEETLSAFGQARRRKCPMLGITSGGRLGRALARRGDPVIIVPPGLPPRAALGYLFVSLLIGLETLGVCRSFSRDLGDTIAHLSLHRGKWVGRAGAIAASLKDRFPLVYSTSRLLDPVADRWRCQLNENAKVLCHTSVFPEHNHNEIVGMGAPSSVARRSVIVALQDATSHPRTLRRLRYALDITKGGYESCIRLKATGRTALARVFSLIMMGDLVSIELARLRRVDPLPVARIDELKRRMAKVK